MQDRPEAAQAVVAGYTAHGLPVAASAFARQAVAAAAPDGPARARSLLWACSRLAAWGLSCGLEPRAEVLLHPSSIERYVAVAMRGAPLGRRRTVRADLRFVARRVVPALVVAGPAPLARSAAKVPYSDAEVAAWFALAAAQPTEARRHRLGALLCLGLGAGLERGELRGVRGTDVERRAGGLAVVIAGERARTVPVLSRYQAPLAASAAFAGARFICGGVSPTRKNVTNRLVRRAAGGAWLGHLDTGRLRATWLAAHLEHLGVAALFAAAGVRSGQRIAELATQLAPPGEAELVATLGW
jgi:integrase